MKFERCDGSFEITFSVRSIRIFLMVHEKPGGANIIPCIIIIHSVLIQY